MKKTVCIGFALLLCALAALTACLPASAFSTITFEPDDTVTALTGGYPRLSRLNDGTLLAICGDVVRSSRDGGKTWVRHNLFNGLASTYTSSTGTVHTLSRENWQGYVMPDGRLMVLYRARTKGDIAAGAEFYTSIRARIFTSAPDEYMNGSKSLTYGAEQVVTEVVTTGFHGFWEPYVVQLGPDTLACYYADDYSVTKPSTQQNIAYNLYTISTGTWSGSYVAINGVSRNSRDGMPVVTILSDGSYAMVFEAFDYHNRSYNNTYGNAAFVISMSRSTDGRNWSTPIPIAAPENITAGKRCAAPFITTLSDGRIVVSYMTDDLYVGSITGEYERSRYCNSTLIVSNGVVTNTSAITATKGGVSSSFTSLGTPVTPIANGYQIWTSVSAFDGDLYFATGCGTNDGSVPSSVQIRHANAGISMPIIEVNNKNADGSIVVSVVKTSAGSGYKIYRAVDGGTPALLATTAATTYTDTAVTPGHTYTYTVAAYSGGDELQSTAKTVDALPPAPTVTVAYDGSKVTVNWTASAGATRYALRRKIVGESSWTMNKAIEDPVATSYTDTTAQPETKYIYTVEADALVNKVHHYSVSGDKIKYAWTVRPSLTLSDATASSIKLTWSASTSAEGYRIYRKVLGDSSYTVIADVGAETLTYTDTGLAPYTSYAYVLRATYTDGTTLRISFDVGGKILRTLCSHSYNGVITTQPTCTETGVKTYTCTVCGNTRTEDVAATGHDFAAEYTVDLAPTCTAVGSKSQHCSRCDARRNITEVPATGHTYDGGVVTTAPQIGTRGVMTYTCTVCGHTLESEIPSLDEVTLAQTPVVEGEAYNEIAARAGEKGFTFVTLAADAESGATAGMVTLTGDASYIYRKNGVYLTPVDFTETGDGVRFVGNAGEQIVYAAEPLVLFGDINADSHLTLSDVLRGFRYLADRTVTIDCAATDLSGNCSVELLDLLLTLRQILGD